MINCGSHSDAKWGVLSGAIFAAILLSGCEGGNEASTASSAPPPAQQVAPSPHPGVMSKTDQIEAVKAALFDDPENPQLLAALGDSYFEAQRFQEAIPVYEKVLKINEKDADTLNDLALAYFYTGNPDGALNTLNKATSSAPDYKFAWLSTGYILVSLGRYDEAIEPLTKAKELDPTGTVGKEADNFLKKIGQLKAQKAAQGSTPAG